MGVLCNVKIGKEQTMAIKKKVKKRQVKEAPDRRKEQIVVPKAVVDTHEHSRQPSPLHK